MKNKGFIKLYRSMLSKPEMTDLVNEQGAAGFGVYIMILLYLAQCDDFEGMFTNGQLSAFAAQARKPRRFVRNIICDYGLFEVDGKRFRIATKPSQSLDKVATKPSHSPARNNRNTRGIKEIDKEKENKEKGVKVPDMIGPSAYEMVSRAGLRYGHHGEPVPWWAPPQLDLRCVWSLCADCWTPPDDIDPETERLRRAEMSDEDFMMKTAYERLAEEEHSRIQDLGIRG